MIVSAPENPPDEGFVWIRSLDPPVTTVPPDIVADSKSLAAPTDPARIVLIISSEAVPSPAVPSPSSATPPPAFAVLEATVESSSVSEPSRLKIAPPIPRLAVPA